MLGSALNYDFICYPLKTEFFDRLDISLQSEINKLFSAIEKALKGKSDIKQLISTEIKPLFDVRIKAIKWFLQENDIEDLTETISKCYDDFDSLSSNPKYVALVENIKFALRCNQRFLDAVLEHENAQQSVSLIVHDAQTTTLPDITYDQFITSIAMGVPDDEEAQNIIDLVNSSLYIEFIAISAGILIEKKLDVSENVAKDLTSIIGNAAQEYSAVCYELGVFKKHKFGHLEGKFNKKEMNDQTFIADLGLDDLIGI